MNNIFDYVKWRGDLSFKIEPFNEVDNLIMSQLSYFPLSLVGKNKISIKNIYDKLCSLDNKEFLDKNDTNLLKLLSQSNRYKDMIVTNYVREVDKDIEKQFVAVSIIFNKDIYVSFGGTDLSIIGFKEDLNMSYLDNVPSQIAALEYLNKVNPKYHIIVGGHSKGGNEAVYASAKANKKIQNKIVAVYNNDGPGFLNDLDVSKIRNKIHSYMPITAIVGRLLNEKNDYKIVNSNSKNISQHSMYSWGVDVNHLAYVPKVDDFSEKTYHIINDWLSKIDMKDRKKFLDSIYSVMLSTNVYKVSELSDNTIIALKNIISSYSKLDKEDKKVVESTLKSLFKSIKKNIL